MHHWFSMTIALKKRLSLISWPFIHVLSSRCGVDRFIQGCKCAQCWHRLIMGPWIYQGYTTPNTCWEMATKILKNWNVINCISNAKLWYHSIMWSVFATTFITDRICLERNRHRGNVFPPDDLLCVQLLDTICVIKCICIVFLHPLNNLNLIIRVYSSMCSSFEFLETISKEVNGNLWKYLIVWSPSSFFSVFSRRHPAQSSTMKTVKQHMMHISIKSNFS